MEETEEAGQPSLGDGWQSTNNDNITNDGNRRYAGVRGGQDPMYRGMYSVSQATNSFPTVRTPRCSDRHGD